MKKLLVVLFITCCIASPIFGQKPIKDLKPTVILVSLDGFRYDYLEKYKPNNLNELAKSGVRAKWMIPSYPSLTFPNHYAIATGLYPSENGIVGNTIYSPEFDATFSLGKREEVQNGRWWLGEPIWVTAEKQGQRAGCFFFPGTEAEIAGKRPTFWKTYDGKIPFPDRVNQILTWLDLPQNERPTFYTLYFDEPDHAGHDFSPESKEVGDAVKNVDDQIGLLMDGLKQRKINKKVNVIIVSDHGMTKFNPTNVVLLDDYFDLTKAEIAFSGQIVNIFPKDGDAETIYQALKAKPMEHAKCYRKSEFPARFHYQNSDRIAPIICMADEGWAISNGKFYNAAKAEADAAKGFRGAHGYDNQIESMRAIFIGSGAAFRKNKVVEPFENISVYNVMARILKLTPAKNDGDLKVIKTVLK
ncbi:MAG: alkaline phosphatase family protein [Pyrinomonadaceae bacterium]|nr:alkaline phosphatase family protein [Pyrinomonadaceae bacterium]